MKLAIPLVMVESWEDELEDLHYVENPEISDQCSLCGKRLDANDMYFDEPALLDVIAQGLMPMPMAMVSVKDRYCKPYNICTTIHHQKNVTGSKKH